MPPVIKVENLSKAYQLGEIGTGTISRDLERRWARIRGKEDPFLKIGEASSRPQTGKNDIIWSLRDLNFEIGEGDAIGIIGKNGAGKSTLLKILSRITAPTNGTVKIKGRIASLLEVGTGFHPELSGRENIYLNGAILGMRKAEIKRKFDEIVDFSGVAHYIDTPVKRYSSGMYVRLAFAVAAHLESEILIVDEVLAVGDAEFQKKCLGKMGDVSRGEGRTVLFVSHNMAAVQKLCNKGLLIKNGVLTANGSMQEALSSYLNSADPSELIYYFEPSAHAVDTIGYVYQLQIEDHRANPVKEIVVGEPWQVRIKFKINKQADHFIIGLGIVHQLDVDLKTSWSIPENLVPGEYEAVFTETSTLFATGTYKLNIGLSSHERTFQYLEGASSVNISDVIDDNLNKVVLRSNIGVILNPMSVKIISV